MPRIHPKTWDDGVMPLSEFPPAEQARILHAVEQPRPPERWISLGLARITSRAWSEWHWARGLRLRYVPGPGRRKIPDRVRAAIYERDGYACLQCGATDHLTIDHIKPVVLGGGNEKANLQTLCQSCNSRKGAKV